MRNIIFTISIIILSLYPINISINPMKLNKEFIIVTNEDEFDKAIQSNNTIQLGDDIYFTTSKSITSKSITLLMDNFSIIINESISNGFIINESGSLSIESNSINNISNLINGSYSSIIYIENGALNINQLSSNPLIIGTTSNNNGIYGLKKSIIYLNGTNIQINGYETGINISSFSSCIINGISHYENSIIINKGIYSYSYSNIELNGNIKIYGIKYGVYSSNSTLIINGVNSEENGLLIQSELDGIYFFDSFKALKIKGKVEINAMSNGIFTDCFDLDIDSLSQSIDINGNSAIHYYGKFLGSSLKIKGKNNIRGSYDCIYIVNCNINIQLGSFDNRLIIGNDQNRYGIRLSNSIGSISGNFEIYSNNTSIDLSEDSKIKLINNNNDNELYKENKLSIGENVIKSTGNNGMGIKLYKGSLLNIEGRFYIFGKSEAICVNRNSLIYIYGSIYLEGNYGINSIDNSSIYVRGDVQISGTKEGIHSSFSSIYLNKFTDNNNNNNEYDKGIIINKDTNGTYGINADGNSAIFINGKINIFCTDYCLKADSSSVYINNTNNDNNTFIIDSGDKGYGIYLTNANAKIEGNVNILNGKNGMYLSKSDAELINNNSNNNSITIKGNNGQFGIIVNDRTLLEISGKFSLSGYKNSIYFNSIEPKIKFINYKDIKFNSLNYESVMQFELEELENKDKKNEEEDSFSLVIKNEVYKEIGDDEIYSQIYSMKFYGENPSLQENKFPLFISKKKYCSINNKNSTYISESDYSLIHDYLLLNDSIQLLIINQGNNISSNITEIKAGINNEDNILYSLVNISPQRIVTDVNNTNVTFTYKLPSKKFKEISSINEIHLIDNFTNTTSKIIKGDDIIEIESSKYIIKLNENDNLNSYYNILSIFKGSNATFISNNNQLFAYSPFVISSIKLDDITYYPEDNYSNMLYLKGKLYKIFIDFKYNILDTKRFNITNDKKYLFEYEVDSRNKNIIVIYIEKLIQFISDDITFVIIDNGSLEHKEIRFKINCLELISIDPQVVKNINKTIVSLTYSNKLSYLKSIEFVNKKTLKTEKIYGIKNIDFSEEEKFIYKISINKNDNINGSYYIKTIFHKDGINFYDRSKIISVFTEPKSKKLSKMSIIIISVLGALLVVALIIIIVSFKKCKGKIKDESKDENIDVSSIMPPENNS